MRARNLKPALFKNEILGTADPLLTILFEGLWCMADRDGRLEDRPTRIKGEVFPYRDNIQIEEMLAWLHGQEFIVRYQTAKLRIIQVLTFWKHQHPHKNETVGELPPLDQAVSIKPGHGPASDAPRQVALGPLTSSLTPSSLTPDSPLPVASLRLLSSAKPPDDEVGLVMDHWRRTWKHPKAALDTKRRLAIKNALKLYSAEILCQAISGYTNSPHHAGQNDRGTVYDDIGLFLRDAAHIDAGLRLVNGSTLRRRGPTTAELEEREREQRRQG